MLELTTFNTVHSKGIPIEEGNNESNCDNSSAKEMRAYFRSEALSF